MTMTRILITTVSSLITITKSNNRKDRTGTYSIRMKKRIWNIVLMKESHVRLKKAIMQANTLRIWNCLEGNI